MARSVATGLGGEHRPAGAGQRHLWMHFSRMGAYGPDREIPIIVRGEGCYVYDEHGNRYLDGLSGLFCVNAGHGRIELGEAAARQVEELDFYTLWSYAHPRAIELAARIASLAPGDLNRVFFTSGGSEAVESALKLARNYHRVLGKGQKHKVIAREIAYHGTTLGALSATGITELRSQFEPLAPGGCHVPNTNLYRWPEDRHPLWAADRDRGADPVRGPGDGRRGDPRAGAERRRLLRPAGRLLPARARDLRPPRRAADLRRGDLRLGPARPLLRLRALRLRARHHHRRQGAHLGLRADGRGDRLRPRRGAVHGGRAPRSPTASPSAATRWPRRSRWPTSTSSSARTSAATCCAKEGEFRADARDAARHPDRRRRARRRLLPGDRAGQGPGDQGDLQRRGVRGAAARLPLRRALPARPDLPRRRPRRPGGPARAAADRRQRAVRRDRRRPARRARRGRGSASRR